MHGNRVVALLCSIPNITGRLRALTKNWLLHYLRIGLLMVSCTMLFLFFASGIYSDRITAANKYVAPSLRFIPQANRSLRTFNMYLNMRTVSQLPRWLAATPFRRAQDSEPVPADASSCAKEKLAPSSPRRMFQRRTAVQIPPTRNARGEIVFSSRVDSNFREGYERYRNAFERKRREKLEAQRRSKPAWFSSFWSSQEKPPSQEKEAPLHLKAS